MTIEYKPNRPLEEFELNILQGTLDINKRKYSLSDVYNFDLSKDPEEHGRWELKFLVAAGDEIRCMNYSFYSEDFHDMTLLPIIKRYCRECLPIIESNEQLKSCTHVTS